MNLPFRRPDPGRGEPAFDARPLVAVQAKDRSPWWFAGGAVIAAVLLFSALEARRQGMQEAKSVEGGTTSYAAAPELVPDLVMPIIPQEQAELQPWPIPGGSRPAGVPMAQPAPAPVPTQAAPSYPAENPYRLPPPPPPLLVSGEAVPQAGGGLANEPLPVPADAAKPASGRIMAARLENPSTTVVQGTLINAVLETALDSTRPGQARAVVTRDIHGFDGTRVLVPRGSRLYGSYEADVAQGQDRAEIHWTRLLRPDGVSIALDSPAADPLGRAGVRGKVNTHFMARLGNALLGTAANVGSALATPSIGNTPVVVAVPGAAQATQQLVPQQGQIMPTLTVAQGTRISVFVQHDLDFSSVDKGR